MRNVWPDSRRTPLNGRILEMSKMLMRYATSYKCDCGKEVHMSPDEFYMPIEKIKSGKKIYLYHCYSCDKPQVRKVKGLKSVRCWVCRGRENLNLLMHKYIQRRYMV